MRFGAGRWSMVATLSIKSDYLLWCKTWTPSQVSKLPSHRKGSGRHEDGASDKIRGRWLGPGIIVSFGWRTPIKLNLLENLRRVEFRAIHNVRAKLEEIANWGWNLSRKINQSLNKRQSKVGVWVLHAVHPVAFPPGWYIRFRIVSKSGGSSKPRFPLQPPPPSLPPSVLWLVNVSPSPEMSTQWGRRSMYVAAAVEEMKVEVGRQR